MRAAKLTADPLWQCLCPAWTTTARRSFSTAVKRSSQESEIAYKPPKRALDTARLRAQFLPEQHSPSSTKEKTKDAQTLIRNLESAAKSGAISACREYSERIVREKGERPSTRIYNALILANTHIHHGAAWRVHQLLADMEMQKIELDDATCHNVLRVLAVHPDHLLREDILLYMKNKWLTVSDEGQFNIVVGQLRDGCFEMALDTMERLRQNDVVLPSWLLDMAAYMLSDAGEFDAAYQNVRQRWNSGEQTREDGSGQGISDALWYWLLDKSSAALHHPLTDFIWRTMVQTERVCASTGMCINIMSTAARAGDPALATQVFDHLTKRGERITGLHFQLLIDAYMSGTTPDLEKALSVLAVMHLEKLPVTRFHTRSVYTHLKDSPDLLDGAYKTLERLGQEGKTVPLAAFNVLIESYCHQNNLEGAMEIYQRSRAILTSRQQLADNETIQHLLRACRNAAVPDTKLAETLISELLSSGGEPDLLTFDRVVLIFTRAAAQALLNNDFKLSQEHVENACRWFRRCQEAGFIPRYGTVQTLSSRLAELGDSRCWDLFQYSADNHGEDWGERLAPTRARLEEQMAFARQRALLEHYTDTRAAQTTIQDSVEA